MYRAAFILAVSALDHFIHEKVLQEMLAIDGGTRSRPPNFDNYRVSLGAVTHARVAVASSQWLENEVRALNSTETYQRPDKIADAIRLITQVPLWPAVAGHLGSDAATVRTRLNLIVNRRNQIAHEADCVPGGYGQRWPIDHAMCSDTISFISDLIEAVEVVV